MRGSNGAPLKVRKNEREYGAPLKVRKNEREYGALNLKVRKNERAAFSHYRRLHA